MLTAFEKMGMTPGRFRIEWISAAEGDKYAEVINEMQALLDTIPDEKLHARDRRNAPGYGAARAPDERSASGRRGARILARNGIGDHGGEAVSG